MPFHQAERRLCCIVAGELCLMDGEDNALIEKVAKILANEEGKNFWQERRSAAATLGKIMMRAEDGRKLATPTMERGLSAEVRDIVTPAVRRGLRDEESWETRREAAITAGKLKLKDTALFNILQKMAYNDKYWAVRAAAVEAIGQIGENRTDAYVTAEGIANNDEGS